MECDLEKLRNLSKENKNFDKIKETIKSLADREDYAKYHYQEYIKLIDSKKSELEKVEFAFKMNNNKDGIAIKANLIACMQNMHTRHDILSHLIYYTLELNDITEDNVSLFKVMEQLEKNKISKFQNLYNLVNELKNDDNFKYLNANVNHSKHRYIIDTPCTMSFVKDKDNHCIFKEFTHKGTRYLKRDTKIFINYEYDRESGLFIEIQNELIAILEKTMDLESLSYQNSYNCK